MCEDPYPDDPKLTPVERLNDIPEMPSAAILHDHREPPNGIREHAYRKLASNGLPDDDESYKNAS